MKKFTLNKNLIRYNGGYIGIGERIYSQENKDRVFYFYTSDLHEVLRSDVYHTTQNCFEVLFATENIVIGVPLLDLSGVEEDSYLSNQFFTQEQLFKGFDLVRNNSGLSNFEAMDSILPKISEIWFDTVIIGQCGCSCHGDGTKMHVGDCCEPKELLKIVDNAVIATKIEIK